MTPTDRAAELVRLHTLAIGDGKHAVDGNDQVNFFKFCLHHAAAILAEMQQQLAEKDAATAELRAENEELKTALNAAQRYISEANEAINELRATTQRGE